MQNKILDVLLVICIFLLISIIAIGPKNIQFGNIKNIAKNINITETKNEISQTNSDNNIETNSDTNNQDILSGNSEESSIIKLNEEIPLSGKSKEEIFQIRKDYVNESIFASDNYEPSDAVLGQIEDGKPWLSTQKIQHGTVCETSGASAHSKELVNPSILIHIDWPYYFDLQKYPYAGQYTFSLLPDRAYYNEKAKEITVYYSKLIPSVNAYILNGINARDFGYEYIYVDTSRSRNLPNFNHNPNVTNTIAQLRDFIHVGGSCGVEGGCNNASPWQPNLAFLYSKDNFHNGQNEIYIKLWKEMPVSTNQPADITERIILLPHTYRNNNEY